MYGGGEAPTEDNDALGATSGSVETRSAMISGRYGCAAQTRIESGGSQDSSKKS